MRGAAGPRRAPFLPEVQGLAKQDGSKALSLLAQRVQAAALLGADPFAKVKGMIQEMIEKLVAEAQKEASHKAFCDKEIGESTAQSSTRLPNCMNSMIDALSWSQL